MDVPIKRICLSMCFSNLGFLYWPQWGYKPHEGLLIIIFGCKHSLNTGAMSKLAIWVAKQSKQTLKNGTTVTKQLENIEPNWYQGKKTKKTLRIYHSPCFLAFFKKYPYISSWREMRISTLRSFQFEEASSPLFFSLRFSSWTPPFSSCTFLSSHLHSSLAKNLNPQGHHLAFEMAFFSKWLKEDKGGFVRTWACGTWKCGGALPKIGWKGWKACEVNLCKISRNLGIHPTSKRGGGSVHDH